MNVRYSDASYSIVMLFRKMYVACLVGLVFGDTAVEHGLGFDFSVEKSAVGCDY